MAQLIEGLSAEQVSANLRRVRAEIDAAAQRSRAIRGDAPVQLLAATKYIPADELPVLAQAGISLVGENRAQDLEAKVAEHGDLFE